MIPLHGIGARQDLPLPFEAVLVGAALVLMATFVLLIFAWKRPRWTDRRGKTMPRLTRFVDAAPTRAVGRAVGLAFAGWATFALVFGQDRLTNPIFGVVYVWMWVGLVPVSILFGPVWAAVNPLRTLAIVGELIPGRKPRLPTDKVGVWPAAAGLAAFAWLELVQPDNTTLPVLQGWAIAWVVVVVSGAIVFGDGWVAATDPFEAYATLCSRLSPWQRIDGVVALVNPMRHAATWTPPVGTGAMVCVLLGSTAFDSFGSTTWWIRTTQLSNTPGWVWGTVGLAAAIVVVAGSYWLGTVALGTNGARRLSPSMVPLVVGYAIGHYFSLLIIEGQRTAITWSDPLGKGWNVFGTAELGINTWLFQQPVFTAMVQLVAIVAGHLCGVFLAHDLAIRAPGVRVVRQIPLLAIMVGYTIGGLVLLFRP